ncbi:RNA polymerase sigma factor RpoD/SigA [Zhenhengia sp.]|uniref:sigma-70 family RNA polymerase sigma factor n=1 Tax=Zhenhengia sp. TaxID=2944208 RepID=UPI003079B2A7
MSNTNINTANALRNYLSNVGQYPLLSVDEEKSLAETMVNPNASEVERKRAREALINSNLRLVVFVAKNYRNDHLSLMDLIQAGNVGLLQAVEHYDVNLGYRFSTCATIWIKQAITKSIIDDGKVVRIPAHIFQLQAKYRAVLAELEADGNKATIEQIAAKMGLSVQKVALIQANLADTVSMDKLIDGSDAEGDTIGDLIADPNAQSPIEYTEESEVRQKIRAAVKTLDSRTCAIMMMRYGLGKPGVDPDDWCEEHTLEVIGQKIGLTRERIRQIEKQALSTLRSKLSGLQEEA